jgi:thioredoxin
VTLWTDSRQSSASSFSVSLSNKKVNNNMKFNYLILGIGMAILPFTGCQSQQTKQTKTPETKKSSIEHLTSVSFKQKVFNYELNKVWKFVGTKPAIIDFYADWCGPCRMLAPTVDQIAAKYKGKIDVYKINVDNEQEISSAFGISSIPAILFIPMDNRPQMSVGAISNADFEKTIKEFLKVNE